MGAQDNTEKVLRSLHVLLSKSEPYPKEPSKVIVDKQQVLDLLSDLNTCIYAIMDEYELTKRSRDKAEREFRKRPDHMGCKPQGRGHLRGIRDVHGRGVEPDA